MPSAGFVLLAAQKLQPWYIRSVALSDTSLEAREMQFRIWQSMSDERRSELAIKMTEFARELAKAGIRRDHPEWSERQITLELLRRALWPQPLPAGLK